MKRSKVFISGLCFYLTCMLFLWRQEFQSHFTVSYHFDDDPLLTSHSNSTYSTATNSAVPRINFWRSVVNLSDRAYYFSAFGDKSFGIITLFGAVLNSLKDNIYCCFHGNSSDPDSFHSVGAHYTSLPEGKGLRYSAAFYTCPLPPSSRPYAVSLSSDQCKTPSNILPIVYPQQQKRQFTVCVTPLNYRYSKAYELVEMIELNRILGAEYFVFYNYSTNYNVDKVLEYYAKQGIVEVLEWDLPMKVDTWPKKNEPVEIHYFGQLAALNDCLYRNMHVSKYVVFQDLDEFIIPRQHLTWPDMINNLPPGQGAYIFQCVFFRKEWADIATNFPGKDTAIKYKMNTLLKQNREQKLLGKTHRAKYILDPTKVDTVGIHNIWRFRGGNGAHFVNPDYARMHHYRNWQNPTDEKAGTLDDRIMVYKDQLLKQTVIVWENLKNVPLGPLDET